MFKIRHNLDDGDGDPGRGTYIQLLTICLRNDPLYWANLTAMTQGLFLLCKYPMTLEYGNCTVQIKLPASDLCISKIS